MALYQIIDWTKLNMFFKNFKKDNPMKYVSTTLLFLFLLCFINCEGFHKEDHNHDNHDHDDENFSLITLENCAGSTDTDYDGDALDFYNNYFNCIDVSVSSDESGNIINVGWVK